MRPMSLPGPSRTIVVEPLEEPGTAPPPEPDRAPVPEPAPAVPSTEPAGDPAAA